MNEFIRSAVIFEGMADMDAATVNPATGMMRDEFLVNSTLGTIDRAEGEQVRALVRGLSPHLLGRHVAGRFPSPPRSA